MPERVIQSRVQEVLPGTNTYMVYGQVLSTDYTAHIEMIFDDDIVIEDLVLETVLDGGADITAGPLKLTYPSNNYLELSSSTSDMVLNQSDDSRMLWYPVPAWTRLRWSPYNQYSSDIIIAMTVIGRSL